jgi:outer membrane immunogenic protein
VNNYRLMMALFHQEMLEYQPRAGRVTFMYRVVIASLVGAGMSIGFGGAASAADLSPATAPVYTKAPPPIPYSWTGFYAGVQAGYGWSGDDVDTASTSISQAPPSVAATAMAAASALHFNTDPKGFIGGGTLGYNA